MDVSESQWTFMNFECFLNVINESEMIFYLNLKSSFPYRLFPFTFTNKSHNAYQKSKLIMSFNKRNEQKNILSTIFKSTKKTKIRHVFKNF